MSVQLKTTQSRTGSDTNGTDAAPEDADAGLVAEDTEGTNEETLAAQDPGAPSSHPVSVRTALLRYPVMFLVIVLVVMMGAVGVAMLRSPTYTAEARLLVGQVDVEARAVPGFTAATQSLASVYARVVNTDAVARPAARATDLPIATVRAAISASPIPDSSIIRVEATNADEGRARQLAEAAATALHQYVGHLEGADPYSTQIYRGYQQAAYDLASAQVYEAAISNQLDTLRTPNSAQAVAAGDSVGSQIFAVEGQLVDANERRTLQAQLKANQLAASFQNLTRGVGDTADVVTIAPAASQGSDQKADLEIALLVGIVAGGLLALAAVTVRANRKYLRTLRQEARTAP